MKIKQEEIEKLIKENKLTSCFECGKCTASCPLGEFFGDIDFGHTPRGIIEKALLNADLITGDIIWYCLTCDVCTKGCPSGVYFRDFIEGLRKLVIEKGRPVYGASCKRCGNYFLPTITQKQLLKKLDKEAEAVKYLFICPGCRRRTYSEQMKKIIPNK
jgi:Fe-S oxidoreductase